MEEVEYLEEYKDLILPKINNSSRRQSTMPPTPDDEDSSSIDQDIFESLFDDHSDDEVPGKKAETTLNPRSDERASLDSLDMLVKDLVGERISPPRVLNVGKSKTSNSSKETKRPIIKGPSSSTSMKPKPTFGSGFPKQKTNESEMKADSSTRFGKSKSIATVRPTVQSKTDDVKRFHKTPLNRSGPRNALVTSSSSAADVASSSAIALGRTESNNFASRKQISVATSTTNISSSTSKKVKSVADVSKKPNRPEPTIIRPEKTQSKDPAEDPLRLDDVNVNIYSDMSDSFSLSDISADSLVSLCDMEVDTRNVIEISNDSTVYDRNNLEKIRGSTPSPTVSDDTKIEKPDASTLPRFIDNLRKMEQAKSSSARIKDGEKCENVQEGAQENCTNVKSDKMNMPCLSSLSHELPERASIISNTILEPLDKGLLKSISHKDSLMTPLHEMTETKLNSLNKAERELPPLRRPSSTDEEKQKVTTTTMELSDDATQIETVEEAINENVVDSTEQKSCNSHTESGVNVDSTQQESKSENALSINKEECTKAEDYVDVVHSCLEEPVNEEIVETTKNDLCEETQTSKQPEEKEVDEKNDIKTGENEMPREEKELENLSTKNNTKPKEEISSLIATTEIEKDKTVSKDIEKAETPTEILETEKDKTEPVSIVNDIKRGECSPETFEKEKDKKESNCLVTDNEKGETPLVEEKFDDNEINAIGVINDANKEALPSEDSINDEQSNTNENERTPNKGKIPDDITKKSAIKKFKNRWKHESEKSQENTSKLENIKEVHSQSNKKEENKNVANEKHKKEKVKISTPHQEEKIKNSTHKQREKKSTVTEERHKRRDISSSICIASGNETSIDKIKEIIGVYDKKEESKNSPKIQPAHKKNAEHKEKETKNLKNVKRTFDLRNKNKSEKTEKTEKNVKNDSKSKTEPVSLKNEKPDLTALEKSNVPKIEKSFELRKRNKTEKNVKDNAKSEREPKPEASITKPDEKSDLNINEKDDDKTETKITEISSSNEKDEKTVLNTSNKNDDKEEKPVEETKITAIEPEKNASSETLVENAKESEEKSNTPDDALKDLHVNKCDVSSTISKCLETNTSRESSDIDNTAGLTRCLRKRDGEQAISAHVKGSFKEPASEEQILKSEPPRYKLRTPLKTQSPGGDTSPLRKKLKLEDLRKSRRLHCKDTTTDTSEYESDSSITNKKSRLDILPVTVIQSPKQQRSIQKEDMNSSKNVNEKHHKTEEKISNDSENKGHSHKEEKMKTDNVVVSTEKSKNYRIQKKESLNLKKTPESLKKTDETSKLADDNKSVEALKTLEEKSKLSKSKTPDVLKTTEGKSKQSKIQTTDATKNAEEKSKQLTRKSATISNILEEKSKQDVGKSAQNSKMKTEKPKEPQQLKRKIKSLNISNTNKVQREQNKTKTSTSISTSTRSTKDEASATQIEKKQATVMSLEDNPHRNVRTSHSPKKVLEKDDSISKAISNKNKTNDDAEEPPKKKLCGESSKIIHTPKAIEGRKYLILEAPSGSSTPIMKNRDTEDNITKSNEKGPDKSSKTPQTEALKQKTPEAIQSRVSLRSKKCIQKIDNINNKDNPKRDNSAGNDKKDNADSSHKNDSKKDDSDAKKDTNKNEVDDNKHKPNIQNKSGTSVQKDNKSKIDESKHSPTKNVSHKKDIENAANSFSQPPNTNVSAKKSELPSAPLSSPARNPKTSPTKSSTSSKSSPCSTVMTFAEWLSQKNEEQNDDKVDKSRDDFKEISSSSSSTKSNSKKKMERSHASPPKATTQSKQKARPRKSEVDILKEAMPKEMIDNGIDLLLTENNTGMVTKRCVSAPLKISSPSYQTKELLQAPTKVADEKGNQVSFKMPTTLDRSITVRARSKSPNVTLVNSNVSSITPKVSLAEVVIAPNKISAPKGFKIRKLKVRLNRRVVTSYFKKLKSKMKPSSSSSTSISTPIIPPTLPATTQNEKILDKTQLPPISSSVISTRSAKYSGQISAAKKVSPVTSVSRAATTPISYSSKAGPANIMTIPPQNRRPPPTTLQQSSQSSRGGKDDYAPLTPSSTASLLTDDVETYLLTPMKESEVNATTAAVLKQQKELERQQQMKGRKSLATQMKQTKSSTNARQIPQVENLMPLVAQQAVENMFVPLQPKEEEEENESCAVACETATAASATVGNIPSSSAFDTANRTVANLSSSSTLAASSSIGLTPTTWDANGTRIYSFLHPAKYNRSHGGVLLDYCCPNLDGPMPAIDPTRIHSQVQTAVRELPAYIVMTTKLITRAELESNKNAIPASIRQKVERITATTSTGSSITTSSTSAPIIMPVLSALQKKLPSSTTITAKIVPTKGTVVSAAASPAIAAVADDSPPALAPLSAPLNQTNSEEIGPLATAPDNQRNLLRTAIRGFDARLRKYYHQIAVLTLPERQAIIKRLSDSTILTPKDVEYATRLIDEYVNHIPKTITINYDDPTPMAPEKPTKLITVPPGQNGQKLKSSLMRSSTTSQLQTPQKRHVPIYDIEKNIIGYQFQVATSASASALASSTSSTSLTSTTSTISVPNKTVTPGRAENLTGPSASKRSGISATSTTVGAKPSTAPARTFYAESSMLKQSTQITTYSPATANVTTIHKNSPRIGRDITVQKIPSAPLTAASTPSNFPRLPMLTRNPHLPSTSSTSSASSSSSRSVVQKSSTSSKMIIVSQTTPEECILPDDTDGSQIKREIPDDFIGGN